jgi:hypothetical protein
MVLSHVPVLVSYGLIYLVLCIQCFIDLGSISKKQHIINDKIIGIKENNIITVQSPDWKCKIL